MSRSASIDFGFAAPVRVSAVIDRISGQGFSFVAKGKVSYLIDRDRMFDWRHADPSRLSAVLEPLAAETSRTALLGITFYLDEVPRGGDLLFFPGRTELSFTIEVNRKNMAEGSRFCDLGWHVRRLVPVMEPLGLEPFPTSHASWAVGLTDGRSPW